MTAAQAGESLSRAAGARRGWLARAARYREAAWPNLFRGLLMNVEELAAVVDELIEVLHLQARQLENLIARVEQVTVRLPQESEMAVIRSSLTGLHQRVKELRGVGP
jgi:hypothetical protein